MVLPSSWLFSVFNLDLELLSWTRMSLWVDAVAVIMSLAPS